MRLLLIRHGQISSNVEGLLDTRIPGPDLTPLGVLQAAALPEALADESVDAIYASVQVRSQLTAASLALALGLEVRVRDGIREIAAGDYEMRRDFDAVEVYTSTIVAWAAGQVELEMPGGETGAEVFARFDAVVAEAYEAGHATAAFFSHGAIIRAWSGYTGTNFSAEFIAENPLRNTGVVVLEGSPEAGWAVLAYMGEAVGGPELDGSPAGDPTGAAL